jgi:hypothetical protein
VDPSTHSSRNPGCCRRCNRPKVALTDGECERCAEAPHIRSTHAVEGHACAVCGVADRRMLRARRLSEGWRLLCANHAAVLGRRWLRVEDLVAECAA